MKSTYICSSTFEGSSHLERPERRFFRNLHFGVEASRGEFRAGLRRAGLLVLSGASMRPSTVLAKDVRRDALQVGIRQKLHNPAVLSWLGEMGVEQI